MLAVTTPALSDAACEGMQTRVFFEDIFKQGRPDEKALETARGVCRRCTARRACLALALKEERGRSVKHRFGLFAAMTPSQRHSLEQRNTTCTCGTLLDPLAWLSGWSVCPCGKRSTVPTLSDGGDDWTERHTRLAQEVVAWLVEHHEHGDVVPAPVTLANRWNRRAHDMTRVYRALVEDGTLVKVGRRYHRHATAVARPWSPAHLA